ncbi:MAG: hypothetical protein JST42_18400 [Bacteroidetes bacterium]|nr:hypothetical protein [Bacteroidota bacterium]
MRKVLALALFPVCLAALFLTTACEKARVNDPLPPCQVTRIIIPGSVLVAANRVEQRTYIPKRIASRPQHPTTTTTPGVADTIDFTYNQYNNPVTMTHKREFGENAIFRYDASNRLTEYINIFSNGAGDFWHKYTYDPVKTNLVIVDTAYRDFVSSNGQMTDYNDIDVMTFQYDSLDRITQSVEYVNGDTVLRSYTYDANGNRQYAGAIYDNMPNIHLTNGTWMFIDREYSLHNPIDNESYTYNGSGYPTSINNTQSVVPGFGFIIIGYPFAITQASFDYSCSISPADQGNNKDKGNHYGQSNQGNKGNHNGQDNQN